MVLWDRIWEQYLAPHHPDNDGELNLVIHHGGVCVKHAPPCPLAWGRCAVLSCDAATVT